MNAFDRSLMEIRMSIPIAKTGINVAVGTELIEQTVLHHQPPVYHRRLPAHRDASDQ